MKKVDVEAFIDRVIQSRREVVEQWQRDHERLHEQDSEAINKAETSINRRLEEMNALRLQITQERGEFLTREMYDREHRTLSESTDSRLKALENKDSNMTGRFWALGVGLGVLVVLVNVAMKLFGAK